MKRIVLTLLFGLTLFAQTSAAERPNILFVFTDDHAAHAISAYGSKINTTPHMDRIAREGMLFEKCYVSNSICGPSRAVILTGKHSHLNGQLTNGMRFDGEQKTFPKLLRKAGYQTAMIGKWHLNTTPQGFDYWEVLPGQGSYYNPVFIQQDNSRKRFEGYATDITTDKAIAWLENREADNKKKPFFLMCQHKAPHRTWAPELKHLDNYADVDIPEPESLFDNYQNRSETLAGNAMSIDRHFYYHYDLKVHMPVSFASDREKRLKDGEYGRMTPEQKKIWDAAFLPRNRAVLENPPTGKDLVRWKYQRYIKNYLRCVKAVDENVGKLLDYLDKTGLAKNTVVIYSSDQGFYLGEHGWFDKRWMYDESLKMPFIVKWPGVVEPGSRDKHLVQNLDYASTFLEMAGAPVPADLQGKSLVPLLKGESPKDWRKAIYYHYYEYPSVHMVPRHYGIRTARHKLMRFYQFDEWEFYDLRKDPDELHNAYADSAQAKTVKRLKTQLEKLRKRYQDDSDVSVMPKEWQNKVRPPQG